MKQIKFISIGKSNIGKTRFYKSLLKITDSDLHGPTIGVSYFTLEKFIDFNSYKCRFWDAGGGPTFHALLDAYVKSSDSCLLFFDYKDSDSLKFITDEIENLYRINPDIILLAIGFNYSHMRLNNTSLVHFVKTKKYTDKLKFNSIPIFTLESFNHHYVKSVITLVINEFIKICKIKNIKIKEKEPSFAENLEENPKTCSQRFKELFQCFFNQ